MGPATPATESKNVYHIGGIAVEFPYQPYGSQLAFMGRVISTLDRAQREGHCHALLESPTGTGKSLSLLCSALAWQKNYRPKNLNGDVSYSKPDPEALSDPLGHGGGFVPETEPSSVPAPENSEPLSAANGKNKKKKGKPTIFYASRTHTQISQVIREYRKTAYRVPMAVLASRKRYCTNREINTKENIDEECKLLVRDQDGGCLEFKNMHKIKGHPSLQKGGCHEAHDIEDLVKVGQVVKGCAYYAARDMADTAQLVFCPYSYLINPVIRGAMEIDIKGAILIFDEAHNMEDIARDAGSVDVEEEALYKLQTELGQLCAVDNMIYQPLYEMTQGIISWIDRKKNTLEKHEFQHYFSCWTGDEASRELQEANISQQSFPILQECIRKVIKAAIDTESMVAHLSGISVITLEGLYSALSYFFSENGLHTVDYQLALQRYVKKDAGNAGSWTCLFSLWCLNPAVVFRGIADLSLSVILTSGTLSPMNSFSSELGIQFGTCLEAPHVIDIESQLWTGIISAGPGNYPLNASYKTADEYSFQDALGKSLEEIFKIVPGGTLVFFPSYKLMEKLCSRWRMTGQWAELNKQKFLFVEPRGGSQNDFEPILKGYYESVCRGTKPTLGRKRKVKKIDLSQSDGKESQDNARKKGAAFLAVCRGKVSEGIDFSDENARAVIIIGIPFPNIHNIQIEQKKKYNDMYKSSKNLLSGNEWYCQQAFRALNQAAGRCIRHRLDYGGIIFLDERFQKERNIAYISKWLRKSIIQYDSFDMSLERLQSFFIDAKEQVGKKAVNVLQRAETNAEKIHSVDYANGSTRKKNQMMKKSDLSGQNEVSNSTWVTKSIAQTCHSQSPTTDCHTFFHQQGSQGNNKFQKCALKGECGFSSCSEYVDLECSPQKDSCPKDRQELNLFHTKVLDTGGLREYVELECSPQKDSRCSKTTSPASSHNDPEVCFVKETPGMGRNVTQASPLSFKDEQSCSTIIQSYVDLADQLSFQSKSATSSGPLSSSICSLVVTPERDFITNTTNLKPEIESPLNLSVNSHALKRRKSLIWPSVNPNREQLDTPDAKTPGHARNCSMATRDANRRIEFDTVTNFSEDKMKKSEIAQLHTMNHCDVLSCQSLEKQLQIFCLLCRNPLGLTENDLYVTCSVTSSSKVHLASLLRGSLESLVVNESTSIPVVVSDSSSVNQQLCNRTPGGAQQRGVWCEEDGCVFSTIYCPFCSIPNNCLGVQIMATNASNVKLLNKILFYFDRLEIKNPEASKDKETKNPGASNVKEIKSSESSKDMDLSAAGGSSKLDIFYQFSYKPQKPQLDSKGLRTTKSKLRLPKGKLLSNSRNIGEATQTGSYVDI